MAIRYVKDFEFPSAAGYTKSAPSKVTGQMFAKGGQAKAPKGIMVMIGIGKPAKGPVKKAEGGAMTDSERLAEMAGDANAQTEAERIMAKPKAPAAAKKPAPAAKKGSPYIPNTNIKPDPEYMKGLEEGARTPVYKKGGMAKHDDEAMDRKLIKSMVKPSMLKKAKGGACYAEGGEKKPAAPDWGPTDTIGSRKDMKAAMKEAIREKGKNDSLTSSELKRGGMAQKVQMAKSNAIEASLKGQKKTPYAMGGVATPLQSASLAPRMPNMGRAKSVPVAPAAPMIAPQSMGQKIGVNAMRPNGPNVGAIRAAMAKRASQAMPQNAPSMMKKGGKVK